MNYNTQMTNNQNHSRHPELDSRHSVLDTESKTPKLRFKEFSGEGEEKTLGEITNWASGGTPPKDNPLFWNGEIPWISASSMRGLEYSDSELKITNEGLKKGSKLAKKGSLLLLVRGSMLFNKIPIGIVSRDVAFNQDVKSIEISNCSTSKYILYWFISSEPKILNMVTGTGIGAGKLDLSDLKALELHLPTLPEQQKIAAFLSAIDTKIDQLTRKKKLLEQYKKGVIQKIFSQELRFKADDGSEFPKWEEKKFGEVFSFRTTNSFSRDNLNYDGGEIKNIHYGDIHTRFETLFDITKEVLPFINSDINLNKITENNYCKEGDLIIADASEDYEDVGKCIEIVKLNGEKVLAGLHTILARPDLHNMSIGFNGYLMKSEKIRLQIKTIAQGSKVLSISSKRLAELILVIPKSIQEQTKIATFLSAIDTEITLRQTQCERLKQFKKALLQQMFV